MNRNRMVRSESAQTRHTSGMETSAASRSAAIIQAQLHADAVLALDRLYKANFAIVKAEGGAPTSSDAA